MSEKRRTVRDFRLEAPGASIQLPPRCGGWLDDTLFDNDVVTTWCQVVDNTVIAVLSNSCQSNTTTER